MLLLWLFESLLASTSKDIREKVHNEALPLILENHRLRRAEAVRMEPHEAEEDD